MVRCRLEIEFVHNYQPLDKKRAGTRWGTINAANVTKSLVRGEVVRRTELETELVYSYHLGTDKLHKRLGKTGVGIMIADRVDMSKRRVGTVSEIKLVHRSEQVGKVCTRHCFF